MNKFLQLALGALFVGGAVTDFNAGHTGGATVEVIIGAGLLLHLVVRVATEDIK